LKGGAEPALGVSLFSELRQTAAEVCAAVFLPADLTAQAAITLLSQPAELALFLRARRAALTAHFSYAILLRWTCPLPYKYPPQKMTIVFKSTLMSSGAYAAGHRLTPYGHSKNQ
jgi:hypothetical protein